MMRASWRAVLLGASVWSGCYVGDPAPPYQANTPCDTPGARDGVLLCQDGTWRIASPVDMAADLDAADSATDAASDMDFEDLGCISEADEELCDSARRCRGLHMLTDRCGIARQVMCPMTCAMGTCDPTNTCVGSCQRIPCPSTLVCGRAADGCGAMQLCDACGAGSLCDVDTLTCVCTPPGDAALCAENSLECGEASVESCAGMRTVRCGPCAMGTCSDNICQLGPPAAPTIATIPSLDARFGQSVALHSGRLIVGAPGVSPIGDVEIFELSGGNWTRAYRASMANDISQSIYSDAPMGESVAMSPTGVALLGKRARVGGDSDHAGVAVVTRRGALDWRYAITLTVHTEKLDPGYSVGIAGNTALVGAPGASSRDKGWVNLFTLGASLTITNQENMEGNQDNARTGESVALTASRLVYGSPGFSNNRGRCDLRAQNAAVQWGETVRVDPFMGESGDRFCQQVAIVDDLFAAGMPGRAKNAVNGAGAVQLFTANLNNVGWNYVVELSPVTPEADCGFGEALALPNAQTLIVGAPRRDAGVLSDAGAVYIYRLVNGAWSLERELRSPAPTVNEFFGASVAAHGDVLVVGAPGATAGGRLNAGKIYIYQL